MAADGQYYLFILHCGATVYSMLYSEYMFVAGFGRYRNLINPSCEYSCTCFHVQAPGQRDCEAIIGLYLIQA